jgi:hypothetical protein
MKLELAQEVIINKNLLQEILLDLLTPKKMVLEFPSLKGQ